MKKLKTLIVQWARPQAGLYGVLVLATPSQAAERPRARENQEDG
ncbi:hypothetical protein [Methylovirgula sp. 4M-Z18]|nr:hypothetical protein [Methylovirgula sp. 4M-Z18]